MIEATATFSDARIGTALAVLAGATFLAEPAARAQEAENAAEGEGATHSKEPLTYRHIVSVSGGVSAHTERDDVGGALALSYAYVLSHKWVVGLKLEYASSELERDFILIPGVVFEPAERLEFGLGVGVERANKDEIEHGEEHTVDETEALVRLTVAYVFPLGGRWGLSPEFNADLGGSRVTYVYALVLSAGL